MWSGQMKWRESTSSQSTTLHPLRCCCHSEMRSLQYPIFMVWRLKWDLTENLWHSGLNQENKLRFIIPSTPALWKNTKQYTDSITPKKVFIGIMITLWPWQESMCMLVLQACMRSSTPEFPLKNKTFLGYMETLREDTSQFQTKVSTRMEV